VRWLIWPDHTGTDSRSNWARDRATAGASWSSRLTGATFITACGYALANKGHDTRAIQGWSFGQETACCGRGEVVGRPNVRSKAMRSDNPYSRVRSATGTYAPIGRACRAKM
jgi:hypothetical protein